MPSRQICDYFSNGKQNEIELVIRPGGIRGTNGSSLETSRGQGREGKTEMAEGGPQQSLQKQDRDTIIFIPAPN